MGVVSATHQRLRRHQLHFLILRASGPHSLRDGFNTFYDDHAPGLHKAHDGAEESRHGEQDYPHTEEHPRHQRCPEEIVSQEGGLEEAVANALANNALSLLGVLLGMGMVAKWQAIMGVITS